MTPLASSIPSVRRSIDRAALEISSVWAGVGPVDLGLLSRRPDPGIAAVLADAALGACGGRDCTRWDRVGPGVRTQTSSMSRCLTCRWHRGGHPPRHRPSLEIVHLRPCSATPVAPTSRAPPRSHWGARLLAGDGSRTSRAPSGGPPQQDGTSLRHVCRADDSSGGQPFGARTRVCQRRRPGRRGPFLPSARAPADMRRVRCPGRGAPGGETLPRRAESETAAHRRTGKSTARLARLRI